MNIMRLAGQKTYSDECRDDTKATTDLGNCHVLGEVTGSKDPEGDVKEEEYEEQRNRRAEGAQEEDKSDEPGGLAFL